MALGEQSGPGAAAKHTFSFPNYSSHKSCQLQVEQGNRKCLELSGLTREFFSLFICLKNAVKQQAKLYYLQKAEIWSQ